MLNARFVPIERWPGKPTPSFDRRSAQFRSGYLKTLDLLESELGKLGASNILIQAYFTRDQLRNDGWPKGTAKPSNVGVIVSFRSKGADLAFPCDTFNRYEDNLRAIGLALEALRAVDRYGVTKSSEQYKGWARIAAPADQPFSRKEEAAAFIVTQAYPDKTDRGGYIQIAIIANSNGERSTSYKLAAARLHPDKPGGSHEMFVRLQAAMKLLEA